jgi:hypothetical protein
MKYLLQHADDATIDHICGAERGEVAEMLGDLAELLGEYELE